MESGLGGLDVLEEVTELLTLPQECLIVISPDDQIEGEEVIEEPEQLYEHHIPGFVSHHNVYSSQAIGDLLIQRILNLVTSSIAITIVV